MIPAARILGGNAMALITLFSQHEPAPTSFPAEGFSLGTLITELVICVLLLVLLFFFRQRFMKLLCACGAEICLWLACKMAFGETAILSQIMTWITALAAIIIVISVVNHIDWSNIRGKKY